MDFERNDRPHELEGIIPAEPDVAECSKRQPDLIGDVGDEGDAERRAEDRLAFSKRVAELGVVAVKQNVTTERDALLRPRRPRGDYEREHGSSQTRMPARHPRNDT